MIRASNVEELWAQIDANPPRPYSDPSDKDVMKLRFSKAHERFVKRLKEKDIDKALGTEWKSSAYVSRKDLREAVLSSRSRRKRSARQ